MASIEPQTYWENRLQSQFNEQGSGHRGFSVRYNHHVYRSKEKAIAAILEAGDISLTGSRLLDVGCGTGFFEAFAQRQGVAALTGIDITQTSVDRLRQRFPRFDFLQASIGQEDPLAAQKTFDGIAALDVLYCLLDDNEFATAFQSLASHLKPGGWLLVSDRFYRITGWERHLKFRSWGVYQRSALAAGLVFDRRLPLYTTLARRGIPLLGPWLLSPWANVLEKIDAHARTWGDWTVRWIANMSLALFRKPAA